MRGRKPTPTHLKVLAGNPGKRPMNDDEPEATSGIPPVPIHMTEDEQAAWKKLGEQLNAAGVLTNLDAMAFEILVRAYVRVVDAARKVAEHGPVWMEKGDSKIPKFAYSPYWAMQNKEEKKLIALLAEFGLTPSSRTRVKIEKEAKKDSGKSRFFQA